jgi:DNA-binding FrmR family transcriptional regulator
MLMKLQNDDLKTKLAQRLRRVGGQIRGIETMIEEGRDCREIVQQLSAAQSALQGFGRALLEEYAVECLIDNETDIIDRRKREQSLRELVTLINKVN